MGNMIVVDSEACTASHPKVGFPDVPAPMHKSYTYIMLPVPMLAEL